LPKLEAKLRQLTAAQEKASGGVEVRIRGLMMDPATSMPIVVLKDIASETVMPIWVGIFEANAIAIEIEKVAAPRPMTHDLTRNVIRHLNARLEKVVISELKDDTFFALLWLRQGDEPLVIDARPSDAIALALRADCPIYVAEEVMQTAKLNTSGPPEGPTAEQLRGWLEGLNDEDLGRYKM
jgi:bifunctional DNase/RNase